MYVPMYTENLSLKTKQQNEKKEKERKNTASKKDDGGDDELVLFLLFGLTTERNCFLVSTGARPDDDDKGQREWLKALRKSLER